MEGDEQQGDEWLGVLLRRFDTRWLPAADGLDVDGPRRSGLRRISARDVGDRIDRILAFYRSERDKLVAAARARLGRFGQEAEDVVQEVMRRICENPPELRDPAKLRSYVYAAVYNETATKGGRAATEHARRAPADDHDTHDVVDPGSGFDDVVVFNMVMARALAGLSPRERQLIELVDINRITLREAAERIGITLGTAKSYHHAARHRLRGDPGLVQLRRSA